MVQSAKNAMRMIAIVITMMILMNVMTLTTIMIMLNGDDNNDVDNDDDDDDDKEECWLCPRVEGWVKKREQGRGHLPPPKSSEW